MTMTFGCGSDAIWRTVSKGEFTCRNQACASHEVNGTANYRVVQAQRWLRVLFLPLVPLGRESQLVECETCAASFSADVTDSQPGVAAPAFDRGTDRSMPSDEAMMGQAPTESRTIKVSAQNEDSAPASPPVILGSGGRQADCLGGISVEAKTPTDASPDECGICGEARPAAGQVCGSCGAVFVDRSTRSCVRHRIALPNDVTCPDCGPDGILDSQLTAGPRTAGQSGPSSLG